MRVHDAHKKAYLPEVGKVDVSRTPEQRAIEELALTRFAFLITEKGFRRGPTKRSAVGTTFYYLAPRVGFKILVEYNYDRGVLFYLLRTQDGRLLPEWDTFSVTRRWQRSMEWLLVNVASISRQTFDELNPLYTELDPANPGSYDSLFTAYSRLVRSSIDELASQPYEVLFPPSVPRG